MKIVVQWLPSEDETILFNLNKNNFVVDNDIYSYFFEEVFWKGVKDFVERKYKIKFKDIKNVDGAKAVENLYYNQEIISRYWQEYNKIRDKFYLHKGAIYTYKFIGFINVGHEIEIYRYEVTDLVDLCNKLTKRKGLFKEMLEKIRIKS